MASKQEHLISKRIFDESHEFRLRLPTLVQDESLIGKFVVFRYGKVHAVASTFEAAYQKGLSLFGAISPFYVDVVTTKDWLDLPLFEEAYEKIA